MKKDILSLIIIAMHGYKCHLSGLSWSKNMQISCHFVQKCLARSIFGNEEIVRIKLPKLCRECTFADVEIVMARHETCCCCLRSSAGETASNYIKQQSAKTHECGSIMQTLLKNTPFQTCSAMEISDSAIVWK